MIQGFRDQRTEKIFHRQKVKGIAEDLQRACYRKLLMLHAAESLDDLRVPPGNRLEKLVGDRAGHYSIRVNSQWRVCFAWNVGNALDVELVDYH